MHADPVARSWTNIVRTATYVLELILAAVLCILFAGQDALDAMRASGLFNLNMSDQEWETRLRRTAVRDGFFHTITRQGGEGADKETKLVKVTEFRSKLRQTAIGSVTLLREQHLVNYLARATPPGMAFGEFKSYIGAKLIGLSTGDFFRVASPPPELVDNFRKLPAVDAKCELLMYVLNNYTIILGPNSINHVLRLVGLTPKHTLPSGKLKYLLMREYVEVFPQLIEEFWIWGYSPHDHEHCTCEAEKFHRIAVQLGWRS